MAIVRPAEFVIFRLSQWAGPASRAGDDRARQPQRTGVYRQDVFPPPSRRALPTGVPVFLGYADAGPDRAAAADAVVAVRRSVRRRHGDGHLAAAVRGFFENDGLLCYVVPLDARLAPIEALRARAGRRGRPGRRRPGLRARRMRRPQTGRSTAAADLQAESSITASAPGDRFAILDAVATSRGCRRRAPAGRRWPATDGALYHPWLWVAGPDGQPGYVPPCGHVAGVYSRSDQRVGVHKAPANEVLEGVLDLQRQPHRDAESARSTRTGSTACGPCPAAGIRVWGARTLSADPAWRHVSARRVLLTVAAGWSAS